MLGAPRPLGRPTQRCIRGCCGVPARQGKTVKRGFRSREASAWRRRKGELKSTGEWWQTPKWTKLHGTKKFLRAKKLRTERALKATDPDVGNVELRERSPTPPWRKKPDHGLEDKCTVLTNKYGSVLLSYRREQAWWPWDETLEWEDRNPTSNRSENPTAASSTGPAPVERSRSPIRRRKTKRRRERSPSPLVRAWRGPPPPPSHSPEPVARHPDSPEEQEEVQEEERSSSSPSRDSRLAKPVGVTIPDSPSPRSSDETSSPHHPVVVPSVRSVPSVSVARTVASTETEGVDIIPHGTIIATINENTYQ